MLFQCVIFIGASILLDKNTPTRLCFGSVFYDASVQKSTEAPVCDCNRTPRAGVCVAHVVQCANVLCAPVCSMVERAPVIESSGALENEKFEFFVVIFFF